MIVENSTPSKYGRFFLAFEADGEESERKNVKVVNIATNNKRKDFNDVGNDEGTEDTAEDQTDNAPAETEPESGDQDFNDVGNEDSGEDNADDNTDTEEPDGGDQDFNDVGGDEGADDTTTDDGGEGTADESNDAEPEEPEGGDQDFNDVGNGDSGEDNGDDSSNNSDDDNADGPGIGYDSTRKFKLFQEFMSLYNAITNYINKLDFTIKDNSYENTIYKDANNKLREIQDLVHDFMTMKFQASSYVQSMLFYQKMVTAVQLVFRLINKNTEKKDDKKDK